MPNWLVIVSFITLLISSLIIACLNAHIRRIWYLILSSIVDFAIYTYVFYISVFSPKTNLIFGSVGGIADIGNNPSMFCIICHSILWGFIATGAMAIMCVVANAVCSPYALADL